MLHTQLAMHRRLAGHPVHAKPFLPNAPHAPPLPNGTFHTHALNARLAHSQQPAALAGPFPLPESRVCTVAQTMKDGALDPDF